MAIQILDTTNFRSTQDLFMESVGKYVDAKQKVISATNVLLDNWRGKGRQEFMSKYNLFAGKMEDLQEVLTEYHKSVVAAEQAYVETDETIAAQLMKK